MPSLKEFRRGRRSWGCIQVSTNGFKAYEPAIGYSLGTRTDYAQIIKVYGALVDDDHKYSPNKIKESIINWVWGNPNPERICTSLSSVRT